MNIEDVKRSVRIYGSHAANKRGTMTKGKGRVREFLKPMDLPLSIYPKHKHVCLCFDFFFVNGLAFIHSVSVGIQFRTVQHVKDRKLSTILKVVQEVRQIYGGRGFEVTEIRADGEFGGIENDVSPVKMDIVANDEHVPEVERSIRTIKESSRTIVHGLPFRRFPRAIVLELVYFVIRNLNLYPSTSGISSQLSPLSIVRGEGPADLQSFGLEFGSYAQVYNERQVSNTMASRSTGAIALCSTSSGSQYFFSLETGQRILRRQATPLPMPLDVIEQVEYLAKKEGQPLIKNKMLLFERRPGEPLSDEARHHEAASFLEFGDDDVDDDFTPLVEPVEAEDDEISLGDYDDASVDEITVEGGGGNVVDDDEPSEPPAKLPPRESPLRTLQALDTITNIANDLRNGDTPTDSTVESPPSSVSDEVPNTDDLEEMLERANEELEELLGEDDNIKDENGDEDENEEKEERGNEPSRYRLRNRRTMRAPNFNEEFDEPNNSKSYSAPFQFAQQGKKKNRIDPLDCYEMHKAVVDVLFREAKRCADKRNNKTALGVVLNQMGEREGVATFGQRAVDALFNEFTQLDHMEVFEGVMAEELSYEQKKGALTAINLIKEKRDGTIKGRCVGNGRKQRGLYPKEQTASPTISNDAMMMTLLIDAMEERDVGIADVKGAYLLADMKDFVLLKMVGQSVDILCDVNPKYKRYVTFEKGKRFYICG